MRQAPIELNFIKPISSSLSGTALNTFSSYMFDRNIITSASAFRFTAPGVDDSLRASIRSGDTVSLYLVDKNGFKQQIATGFIDETDTHVQPTSVDFVLTGRDTLGQLVDNASVDSLNSIKNTQSASLLTIATLMVANTRMPQGIVPQQLPNGNFLFQTNPGETKINSLQRYLDLANCIAWTLPDGRLKIGKPNFTQNSSGVLTLVRGSSQNNVLEARVKRNVNQAIRQIVYQLQTMDQVWSAPYTKYNNVYDIQSLSDAKVGRSVYEHFSYGSGNETVNTITHIGNQSAIPRNIGDELALRDIARENMRLLDIDIVVKGHFNSNGIPYNIDQIYTVQIEADDVNEDMLIYGCTYELTLQHGMLTRLRLCKIGSITANGDALPRSFAG